MSDKAKKIEPVKIAVIGGSGVYEIDGIDDLKEVEIKTPFGAPSDKITIGTLEGVRCAFLPRHGRGHRILPSELNARANIYALKTLGVEQIISISACGSLREDVKPRDFLIPDQIFDRTRNRPSTFFGDGIVGHVGVAEPFCNGMRDILHQSVKELGINHHFGGTYVCIEGPQFSTRAESEVNRKHGFSIVGMTAVPEAKLAREAEICYSTVGLVTDYDVWKEGEEVTVDVVLANMHANVSNSKKLIKHALPRLIKRAESCACRKALEFAVMTSKEAINKETLAKLEPILGKYYK
ncbi:MAG TPA: S-methyl-5'-thioadenosine phosphorylase [Elusimicrobia bacterium]|nr:MAG: methylthioadenosine phosphorylase [Elusimicrobia bacterium RIFOXYA12_FULL_49_49]OGS11466.1 MAG: methylthioadenosine phosphorylase [Elusimicrobia bacterium RIFOXYB1_FULL_48_9]OGS15846.1 MAG: methylthioadenosine phosphorylase [Elusimicrobia bacterium RIFOXYA2_FULL_47_53]OGS27140.1 MAG: methylthioadenosine phosphorylase [Elusimicrobia bacterium RIFOXYB12_FULL_50_12]OGS31178.1 MAG: methylthioadenosine phosphorylase [Elusimicrobia bacterium RIFOXYB2_FULL_46_23]HBU70155.1 S-methyl-5'-thioade